MRKDVLSSPRLTELKKRRRKNIQKKFTVSFFGLLAILILLAFLSRLESLNISEIKIEGNKVIETEKLREVVTQKISEKYLGIFPKTNIFYYPQRAITNTLQDNFKRIKEANVSVKEKKILEVLLIERMGEYIWCGTNPNAEKEECYFSDEEGYIFAEAPYFSGEVYFKLYGLGGLEIDNPIGNYFLQPGFTQLISFKDTLIDFGMKPVALYYNSEGDLEFFLTKGNSASVKPRVILRADADFQNTAENLKTALDTEPLYSQFKEKYSTLQYLDLRFGDKVYYKFK